MTTNKPKAKKSYTNGDIINRLDKMDGRLVTVENWKNGIEIGKAAVDEYKRQEESTRMNKSRTQMYSSVKDLMPYAIGILAAVASLVYVYASRVK